MKCVKRLHLFVWSAATWRALYSTLDGARGQVADFSRLGAHIYSVYLLLEAKHFSRFDPKSLTFAATVEVLGPPGRRSPHPRPHAPRPSAPGAQRPWPRPSRTEAEPPAALSIAYGRHVGALPLFIKNTVIR